MLEDPAYQGLLADILANTQDDTPRLVLADWLDEHSFPERAEFIRCQCLVERWASTPGDPEGGAAAGAALARSQQLLAANEGRWLGWLKAAWGAEWVPARECGLTWRRGFVASVTLSCADWLMYGPAVVACQPVEGVTLSDREPAWIHNAATGHTTYFWYPDEGDPPSAAVLPEELFDLLTGESEVAVYEEFGGRAEALAALSRACVAFGRAEARKFRHARQEAR